jgi:hypothetical protein
MMGHTNDVDGCRLRSGSWLGTCPEALWLLCGLPATMQSAVRILACVTSFPGRLPATEGAIDLTVPLAGLITLLGRAS